ncbi:hypothetical protein JIN85_20520 [Luteolibacter pohnpeiensis]|uniref:Uncharacterized protein n=1 Tax=Luteolibacter pohnpeiensis TaxID=454153 RepID=A0A934SC34_9BACT|nr:hypothetical protein [Luteolibacter pohnpeiensis]
MKLNRYLRTAKRHFLTALCAGAFAVACVIWAFAAALYQHPGWCIASVMAAVLGFFVSAVEGNEAHRCLEDSEKFERGSGHF